MVETVLAVLFVSLVFLVLFKLSHQLTGKILLEHAAMRVARARAVGLNDFMCEKAARVAVLPVAGRRLWPTGEDALNWDEERHRVSDYMASEDEARARGILEYEGWQTLDVRPGDGRDARVSLGFSLFDGAVQYDLEGRAGVESSASLYMTDQGL